MDPRVIFKILAENKQAKKVLDDTATSFDRLSAGASKMAVPAAAVLGAIAGGAILAVGAASDAEQAWGGLESVFKDNAGTAKKLAGSAAKDVGLASTQYANLATILGSQLKGMGTASDALVPKTDQLIKLGSDLAATYGGTTADAVEAVSSLLRGERDPIEKYGVSLKQVDIDAQRAADGMGKATGAAKTQADATATLELLLKKTADAQGGFAREADTAAHAQQVANAQFTDATAALGVALLPVVVLVANAFSDLAGFVKDNTTVVQIIIGVIGALAAAILAVAAAQKIWAAGQAIVTAAQWLLNAAMTANPIGIVVVAIAALVAALILLWQNSETFRTIVTGAFNAVLSVVTSVVGTITDIFGPLFGVLLAPFKLWLGATLKILGVIGDAIGPFVDSVVAGFGVLTDGLTKAFDLIKAVWSPIAAVMSAPFNTALGIIKSVIGTITRLIGGLVDTINGIFRKINDVVDAISNIPKLPFTSSAGTAPAPAGVAVPGLRAASRAGSGGGAQGPITVNVYTTGDSMQAEQAVLRALRRQTRINGGVVPAFGWSGVGGPSLTRSRVSPQPRG